MGECLSMHILLDLYGCQLDLNNPSIIHNIMLEAAKRAKTTVLNSYVHQFSPQGVTCVVVVSESHLSIHTWPEYKHAEVDVYTCGNEALPSLAVDFLHKTFEPKRSVLYKKERGEVNIINYYRIKQENHYEH